MATSNKIPTLGFKASVAGIVLLGFGSGALPPVVVVSPDVYVQLRADQVLVQWMADDLRVRLRADDATDTMRADQTTVVMRADEMTIQVVS